jgi:pimeloyl-ACP methyl ester carboxylesterase
MKARVALLALLLLVLFCIFPLPRLEVGGWMASSGIAPRYERVLVGSRPLTLRYVRKGAGESIVLLHGLASSIVTFRAILPDLARDHDVIAVDLPGFGGSEIPSDLTLALLPEAVLALLDRLGVHSATLLGNSLGGGVAAWIAAEHKERVDRLVLVDSVGFNLERKDWPRTLRLSLAMGRVLDPLPLRRLIVSHALHEVFFDPGRVTRSEVDEYLAPLLRPGAPAASRAILSSSAEVAPRLLGAIRELSLPTLVVWGREDRWIPVGQALLFAQAIPGARLAILDGCGHMPQEECPERTLAEVRRFLGSRGP